VLLPNGRVVVATGGKPVTLPSPYSVAEVENLLKGKDLATTLHAIGPDIFSQFSAR